MASSKNSSIVENIKMERDAAIRARDDLVAQLRIVKKKLEEAEEEQYKAEENATALRAELEALHRKEEYRNMISSSSSPDRYLLLEQEVTSVKLDLQNALQQLQQERQKVQLEQKRVADLLAEREQLRSELSEVQHRTEEQTLAARYASTSASKVKTEQDYQLRELASMVERLESGRQKLLAEIDFQSMEIERLFMENDSLTNKLNEASTLTVQWEHQLQEFLKQNADLRSQLHEFRLKQANNASNGDTRQLQLELAESKGEAEALRAQVLQLSADLKRTNQYISSLNWTYKPVLSKIANRLQQLKQHGSYSQSIVV